MTLKNDIQKKSLSKVSDFVWGLAGTFSVITLTLMFNGINAGRHVDDLITIHVEEKRAAIESRVNLQGIVDNQNIMLSILKKEISELKIQVDNRFVLAGKERALLKENSHKPRLKH